MSNCHGMEITLDYGRSQATFESAGREVGPLVLAPATDRPGEAVRAALETPVGYPALRRALTPDDHVVVVVDDSLPLLDQLLTPVLEHLVSAGLNPESVTLLSPPGGSSTPAQAWIDTLPDAFEEMHAEVHDPTDRKKLSYLATTKKGRRIYLNRTVVDADQVVVLSGRRFDPVLSYAGAESALFPALSDEATRQELGKLTHLGTPDGHRSPLGDEATEAAWLLGAPFFVQVIEGPGDSIGSVVAGSVEASVEGKHAQDRAWRRNVPHSVDLVIAAVSGDPGRQTFADLAAALASAAHVIKPAGRIVLLTEATPELGRGGELLRHAESAAAAVKELRKHPEPDLAAALQWAHAASHARINLLSGLPAETAEELFTTPLDNIGQVARLLETSGSCLFLADAHKALAVLAE